VTGQFGGDGYTPPAPICQAFKCEKGEKAVGKVDAPKLWSYGCKDSGMNVFNMASFDASDPLGGMNKNSGNSGLDKCCVERDICKQTCGMTSKGCHDGFQKCQKKVCKGDKNCDLQAMMSDIMSEPYDEEDKDKDKDKKYDPEEQKCKGYKKGQAAACTCVPKDEFQSAAESKLKSFFSKFNPEKLNDDGEIKDVDDVWKKWKGKEPDMFMALATKYKAKAVQIKTKPKPPPYTPPSSPPTYKPPTYKPRHLRPRMMMMRNLLAIAKKMTGILLSCSPRHHVGRVESSRNCVWNPRCKYVVL